MFAAEQIFLDPTFYLIEHGSQIRRSKQRLCAAVVEDIVDLRRGQAAADGDINQSCPLRAPDQIKKFGTVLKAECHRVAVL